MASLKIDPRERVAIADGLLVEGRTVYQLGSDGTNRHATHVGGADCRQGVTEAEMESLARLFAASDDLRFALRQILWSLPAKCDWLDPDVERFAREAIQKAEVR